MAAPELVYKGKMEGHSGWVTAISCCPSVKDGGDTTVVSASRDKTLIVWKVTGDPEQFAVPHKSLHGHSHFVQDAVVSSDGHYVLSGSWDGTLRLWDLHTATTQRTFVGHKKDVMSVAFSSDNRQIVSASRDKTIKLWNTLGQCKYTIDSSHSEWVSCVRFSPLVDTPLIVSAAWDKVVKVWNLQNCKLRANLVGHKGYLNSVTVSPDGSLCASGGKDGIAMLWDLQEHHHLYQLQAGDCINALCFSPSQYWLCAATNKSIVIWDLAAKQKLDPQEGLLPDDLPVRTSKKAQPVSCISLCWSADGRVLYAGYTDGNIRVWTVGH